MTSKEEKMKEEIEQIKEELKRTKMESAATVATMDQTRHKISLRWLKRTSILIGIVLVIVLLFFAIFSIRSALTKEGTVTNTVSSFAEQIQQLSSLTTAKAYMKAVVEQEDNELFGRKIDANIPGTKRKTLLIIPGEVTAGVDLSKVQEDDVQIDEERNIIQLTLPKAEIIQQPSLDFSKAQVYSSEGLFRGKADIEEGYEMAELAREQVLQEAIEQGLLQSAEEQAERVIGTFFRQFGYETKIQFQSEK
ncbi:DUF4230 domain-containing protein [Fervidibacillus halotolerans]|uniref:DUF4230 domain-containing protein n=1 Tax=Fervidibacillus halotolerans TaxID=2980027 RepID=A0A9E8RYH7_9BACI|nr:DUF4230 domain-containing protein [Fervidibacillus halotolerans]WAA12224.1 DUF4230 domain-containing protein [Fervidibacillus halotolerans]